MTCVAVAALAASWPAAAEVLQAFGGLGESPAGETIVRVRDFPATSEELVVSLSGNPRDFNIDKAAGKLYFVDNAAGAIKRANLDGSSIETLISGLSDPRSLGLDLVNNKLYFYDNDVDKIQRANLDGSSVEDVVLAITYSVWDIAIDGSGGKVYWSDFLSGVAGSLLRADLNGANIEGVAIPNTLSGPIGLALDLNASKIYWADLSAGISRADLDGSNQENIYGNGIAGMTIDPAGSHVYWSHAVTGSSVIERADLDGANRISALPIDVGTFFYLDYDPANRTVYWSDVNDASINRRKIPATDVIASGLIGSGGIAIDVTGMPQIYYVESDLTGLNPGTGSVRRANLDGSGDTQLLSNLTLPIDVAIDPDAAKMYWSDFEDGIQRANQDGSSPETVVPGSGISPSMLALDPLGQKVYWVNGSQIKRADLSGLNIETIVSGADAAFGLAVHPGQAKVYWTQRTGVDRGVYRANLDGSSVEFLTSTTEGPAGEIHLDLSAGKMYWTEAGNVFRANLDGSSVEDNPLLAPISGDFLTMITTSDFNIHVDFNAGPLQDGTQAKPFDTLEKALNRIANGGKISINGASAIITTSETPTINRPITLEALGGPVQIGASGTRGIPTRNTGFVSPDTP